MCRVTTNEKSPAKDGTLRKRSSSTSSLVSSTSRSSSTSSIRKRVSFDDTIRVYQLERLNNEQKGEVFYRPEDYRRFRLDTCLDILDQQEQQGCFTSHNNRPTIFSACQRFLSSIAPKKKNFRRPTKQRQQMSVDYPWLKPYHPHEDKVEAAEESGKEEPEAPSSSHSVTGDANKNVDSDSDSASTDTTSTTTRIGGDTSLERRIIEELAFLH